MSTGLAHRVGFSAFEPRPFIAHKQQHGTAFHPSRCRPPGLPAASELAPAMACQMRSDVAGRSISVTARGDSASRIALTIAGGAPKIPGPQTTLTPRGL